MKHHILTILLVSGLYAGSAYAATEIRFGNHYEPNHPNNECGSTRLVEALKTADVGLELKVYPDAQLGTAPQMLEQLATGELQMAMTSPSDLGAWYPPISVMTAAYVYEDYDDVKAVVASA